ncbi:MAG: DUF4011 domain-containing protein [Dehalococcoidia bacterium]|nr:DUF4011 domain-containing protein [Dehalococcoidia bacterium]
MTEAVAVSEQRRAAVDRARAYWRERLMDFSRRNNLLFYRDLRSGTLELTAMPGVLADFIGGDSVRIDATTKEIGDRLRRIRAKAVENLEERGLATLFVAAGIAHWQEPDGGSDASAPVLLVPAALRRKGVDSASYTLERLGEAQLNPAMVARLAAMGKVLAAESILHGEAPAPEAAKAEDATGAADAVADATAEEPEGSAADLEQVYERLTAAVAGVPGFAIESRLILSNFSFQKMAIVKDLEQAGDSLAAHDIVASLAGAPDAREAILALRVPITLESLDSEPPASEFAVLDSDSSQSRVVRAAVAGQSGVVQGPPGTGKSQVITNLIAGLVASGQRVLFVAEKRAALEVVLKRLEQRGLGDLALDLHGADTSRKQVAARLAQSLANVRNAPAVEDDAPLQRLAEHRARLKAHTARVHRPQSPSGLSVYGIEGRLLRLPAGSECPVRWRGDALHPLTEAAITEAHDLLADLAVDARIVQRAADCPWSNASLRTVAEAQAMTNLVPSLMSGVAALRGDTSGFAQATGAPEAATLGAFNQQLAAAALANGVLAEWQPGVFDEDIEARVKALWPAESGGLPAVIARWFNGGFKSAKKSAGKLRKSPASPKGLVDGLRAAAAARDAWKKAAPGSKPVEFAALGEVSGRTGAVAGDLGTFSALFGRDLSAAPLAEMTPWLESLMAGPESAMRVPAVHHAEERLAELGVGAFVAHIRESGLPPEAWGRQLDFAWLRSCLDAALAAEPELVAFDGTNQQRLVDEFVQLDKAHLDRNTRRVRRAYSERAIEVMNQFPDQAALIRREAQKRARHLPIRRLLAEAPDVLTALTPCFMASPLSVSQLLGSERRFFDVVVFDEASQVLSEDAVTSLMRGERALVAGDRHQLPPTQFFASGEDDEKDDDDEGTPAEDITVQGFESLLDQMSAFLEPWMLQWHYRSRDERLIAFSNAHIYHDLVTFPGIGADGMGVSHVLVESAGRTGAESVEEEVARVVELVVEHARMRPKETLGVIALGITHARRVEQAIEARVAQLPEIAAFFAEDAPERFFVKNLERVQGDERDHIILTLGAGPGADGRVSNIRFGPLNREGGERRLNVAVTRSKRRMTLVSSFTHQQMSPGRPGTGTELLQAYLAYAAAGGQVITSAAGSGGELTPFESDIRDALAARGMPVVPRLGASESKIDFAGRAENDPARFVLAIESDGPGYAGAPTVRDRDRLRRQQLEALGWKCHRIWTGDWFRRRDAEIERAVAAYQAATAPKPATPAAAPAPAPAAPAPVTATLVPENAPEVPGRGPKPRVPQGHPFEDYTPRQFRQMVDWVRADGKLRTDDEIAEEVRAAMGFTRRGARIDAAIQAAIDEATRG